MKYTENFIDFSYTTNEFKEIIRLDFFNKLFRFFKDDLKIKTNVATSIANCLFFRMNDVQLHYHTPVHILSIFEHAEKNNIPLEIWEKLAIWFHDAIYDIATKAPGNEYQSADFMKSLMEPYVDKDLLELAYTQIKMTANHLFKNEDLNSLYFKVLDLDLCNFSWSKENFLKAGECVRNEYLAINDQDYLKNRNNFFQLLLSKGYIYRTNYFLNVEDKAKENLSS